jgi:hypothetical protein
MRGEGMMNQQQYMYRPVTAYHGEFSRFGFGRPGFGRFGFGRPFGFGFGRPFGFGFPFLGGLAGGLLLGSALAGPYGYGYPGYGYPYPYPPYPYYY